MICSNVNDQFSRFNGSSPYYSKLKRGRKLKIFSGIKKDETEYYWQNQLWIIDTIDNSIKAGEKVCTISGRNLMGLLLDKKLYYPDTFWGATAIFDVNAGQKEYQLPVAATGVYKAEVDDIDPRDGADEDDFTELVEGSDFYYNKWKHVIVFGDGDSGATFRTVVRTVSVTGIGNVTALANGRITLSAGTGNCSKRGFYYGTTTDLGSEESELGDFGNGDFSLSLSELDDGETYYIAAFAIGADGNENRGDIMTFATLLIEPIEYPSGGNDKAMGRGGTVYATVHDAVAGDGISGGAGETFSLGQFFDDPNYYAIYRGFLYFDTSSIPAGATITSVILGLYVKNDFSDTDFDVVIQDGQPDHPESPLVYGDYNKNYYSGNHGQVSTVGISIAGYTNITVDPTIVTKEGITKLCIRSSRDISSITPTGAELLEIYTSNGGEDKKPILIVTYEI